MTAANSGTHCFKREDTMILFGRLTGVGVVAVVSE
jgi:hypothetical protein